MAAKRSIMRIQLDVQAKQKLDKLCERRGMTQIAVMSRVVNWFVGQDETIQAIVLGSLSEQSMGSLARMVLKKMAAEDGHV
jgi:predicted transcriptional regulator